MHNKLKIFLAALICSLAFTTSANAAPILQLDSTGILIGATGVLVNNTLFDVQFRDGECGGLPHLCDYPSNFTFTTSADAKAASQALLEQVLVGVYDDNYKLTNGCQNMLASRTGCAVLTPYETLLATGPEPLVIILAEAAFNASVNQLQPWRLLGDDSTRTLWDYATYAVWTQASVSEPSPLALLCAGLIGITVIKRRKFKNSGISR